MRTKPIPRQKTGPNGEKLCRWCEAPVPKGRRTFCGHDCVHEAMLRSDPGYLRAQTKKRDHGICRACGLDTEAIKLRYLQVANIARRGIEAYEALKKSALKRTGIPAARWWTIMNQPERKDVLAQNEAELAWAIKRWEAIRDDYQARGALFHRPHPEDEMVPRFVRRLQDAIELTPAESRIKKIDKRLKRLAEARRKRMGAEIEAAGFRGSVEKTKLMNLWQADHIHPVEHGGGGCGLENIQTLCSPCHKSKTAEQSRRKALVRRGIDPDAPNPQLTLL